MRFVAIAVVFVLVTIELQMAIVPLMFVFSQPGHEWLVKPLGYFTLGLPDWIGQVTVNSLLCKLPEHQCPTTTTLEATQSLFQALFGFGIATGVVIQLRESSESAVDNLAWQIDKQTKEIKIELHSPSYAELAKTRAASWRPAYTAITRIAYAMAITCFYATAIISFALLTMTLVSRDPPLHFGVPISVTFALAPFISLLILFIYERLFCRRLIAVSFAPTLFFKPTALEKRHQDLRTRTRAETRSINRDLHIGGNI